MKNINVFGYATFGTPNGFTQSCIYGNQSLEKVLKTFDLKTNAIQLLSPSDRIYSIRKESSQKNIILSYSVYTYAKEKNSNRSGTFIGTSLIFTDEILPENLTLTSLHDIHINLKNNNVSGDNFVLNINHSRDFNLQNIFSKDFEKLEHQTNKVNFLEWDNSNSNLVIKTEKLDASSIQNLFKKSLQILPKYDTIYFIDSKEIAEFVSQKRLFKIIDKNGLDQEIQILQEERTQKITNAISGFEKEKEKIEEERKKAHLEFERLIEQNQQKHSENQRKIDESKINLGKLNVSYQNFIRQLDELINGLRTDKKLEEINNSHKEYKRTFDEEKRKLESIGSLQTVSNPRTTNHSIQQHRQSYIDYNDENYDRKRSKKLDIFKLVSFILNAVFILAIIGAFAYYTLYYKKENDQIIDQTYVEDTITNKNPLEQISKLNPIPNDSLILENKKIVVDALDDNTKLKTVVEIIFKEAPKNIENIYKYQKNDYSKYLFEKNPNIFKISGNDTILLKKDSLKVIPSLKLDNK